MSKNNVVKLAGRDTIIDPLTELLRTGAEHLIYQAVEAELLELLAEHSAIRLNRPSGRSAIEPGVPRAVCRVTAVFVNIVVA